jgi:hypothetical protein
MQYKCIYKSKPWKCLVVNGCISFDLSGDKNNFTYMVFKGERKSSFTMRLIVVFISFCLSCTPTKKYNGYIGKSKHFLINAEGVPSSARIDSSEGEIISYWKGVKLHTPKY